MKGQKIIFYISATFAALALLCGWVGEFKIDYSWNISWGCLSGHREFFINLCLGVFTGAVLSSVTSLISYYTYKQQTLFNYWTSIEGHAQGLNTFGYRYFKYGSTTDECIAKIRESNEILSDVLALEISYTELAKLRKEISMFSQQSTLKKKVIEAFELAGKVNIELTQLVCIHACDGLSLGTQRQYVNQFNSDSSNLDKLKVATQELQELLGFKVEKMGVKKEDFICHN